MVNRFLQFGVIITATSLVVACSLAPGYQTRGEVRFRVDVVLRDDGVDRAGSGVWSFSLYKPVIALAQRYSSDFDAEAIPIRLSGDRWAFVLPSTAGLSGSAARWPELAFDFSQEVRGSGDGPSALARLGAMYGRTATIQCVSGDNLAPSEIVCPSILLTDNPQDLRSFVLSRHSTDRKTLNQLYIKRLSITITDQPTTKRLEAMLKCLPYVSKLYHMNRSAFYEYWRGVPEYVDRIREPFI